MIVSLYRKYVSESSREKIYDSFIYPLQLNFKHFGSWMKGLFIFCFSPFFPKNDYYDAFCFIGRHGVTNYPFKTTVNYKKIPIEVYRDEKKELQYVVHNGKRLYFPASCSNRYIRKIYRNLLTEQDIHSSHRYLESYEELQDKILLDVGAAEGIFSLDAIEYVKKVYLFECEDKWYKPLMSTFEPWHEKIVIVRKYVNNFNDEQNVTLDSFMSDKEKNNIHLKMDIEGTEMSALKGARNVFEHGQSMSYSVCTYHKKEDPEAVSEYFKEFGYTSEFTKGYFFMMPYMMKAVCRGKN